MRFRVRLPAARRLALAACLAVAALAGPVLAPSASAAVVYSSPMATPASGWFGYAAGTANQFVASSFIIAGSGAATVTGADWVGSVWPGWPAATSFRLDFLDSVAGAGSVIATRTVTIAETDLGLVNAAGFALKSYAASFADVALAAGTQYYLEVSALGANWLWGDGSDPAATTWFSYGNDPTWQYPTTPGRAFTLLGEVTGAAAEVGEPATLALLGAALFGLARLRRQRG